MTSGASPWPLLLLLCLLPGATTFHTPDHEPEPEQIMKNGRFASNVTMLGDDKSWKGDHWTVSLLTDCPCEARHGLNITTGQV
jgi:hypothetical protein